MPTVKSPYILARIGRDYKDIKWAPESGRFSVADDLDLGMAL